MTPRIRTTKSENAITRIAHQSAQGMVSFMLAYAEGDEITTLDALLNPESARSARSKAASKREPKFVRAPMRAEHAARMSSRGSKTTC